MTSKKVAKKTAERHQDGTPLRTMTSADAVFAELESMTPSEREDIAPRLLEWLDENGFDP